MMAPFDFLGTAQFADAGNIMNAVNAWTGSLTSMGELQWIGIITIGCAVAVLLMAITGMINELAKGGTTGQYRH